MGKRREARECALQVLFQLEFDSSDADRSQAEYWAGRAPKDDVRDYASWLVHGILARRADVDGLIRDTSEHWRMERMGLVDRNILRMAVFELLEEKVLAAPIIINEAIEIAKKYSDDKSATFINGLLDAIRKKLAARPGGSPVDEEGQHGSQTSTRGKAKRPGAGAARPSR
jgi:N utilization substance protein B